ncbi:hypothetical protein [Paenibacillus sp. 843]|uniref:hypothetical protein n=1 Tax=Paenibacillus sp. 843 TaxID=3341795 RepID=UPI00372C535C
MRHLLIKYISREDNHVDPNFTWLTYGDSGNKGVQIKNTLTPGSYVFFHTSYANSAYITAYFYVEKILTKGDNRQEIECLKADSRFDEVVIIGSRTHSKILTFPISFDKKVVDKLRSLNINWNWVESNQQTELKTISDSTRSHREISDEEVEWLLSQCKCRG